MRYVIGIDISTTKTGLSVFQIKAFDIPEKFEEPKELKNNFSGLDINEYL